MKKSKNVCHKQFQRGIFKSWNISQIQIFLNIFNINHFHWKERKKKTCMKNLKNWGCQFKNKTFQTLGKFFFTTIYKFLIFFLWNIHNDTLNQYKLKWNGLYGYCKHPSQNTLCSIRYPYFEECTPRILECIKLLGKALCLSNNRSRWNLSLDLYIW